MSLGQRLLVGIAIVALVAAAHACSRPGRGASSPAPSTPVPTLTPTSSPTLTPSPTPVNPAALLQESGKAMEGLESFHFRLDHRSGGTTLVPNLVIQEAQGDVVKPDKTSTEFSGTFGGFALRSSLRTLGDESYMTNPLTGKWESIPTDVSPLGFFNPRQGITAMMSRVDRASLVLGDRGVYRIKGRLPAEALSPLAGTTAQGSTVAVELTLGADDLYLTEAVVDGVVRVITLSRFNMPVTIEAPD